MANDRKPFDVSEKIEDLVNEPKEFSFLDMPQEMIKNIGTYIDIKEERVMVRTCKAFNNFFHSSLILKEALHFAAFGKMKELDALLTKHPDIVYKRGTTLDPCGRTVHGTVYRISLGAKDWNPFQNNEFEEMAEMIERHIKTLPKGEEEIELQKAEQFPEGWEEQEKIKEANDSAALKEVFAAIAQSKTDEDCKDPIEKFINYLKSQNEVNTGYHYNDKLLSEAQDLYVANFNNFFGLGGRKNRLVAIKIIGSIQGRMTACLAMAHCDGLSRMIALKKPLCRRMTLKGGARCLFPKVDFFSPNLGSFHFVNGTHGLVIRETPFDWDMDGEFLSRLMSSKDNKLHPPSNPHLTNQNL